MPATIYDYVSLVISRQVTNPQHGLYIINGKKYL